MLGDSWSQFRRLAKDAGRLLRAKVADRVEDPIEGDPELLLGAHARRFHPVKERFELDPPPVVDNADGDVGLGMHHALSRQTLQHAIGDQFIVFGGAQPLADRFERQQEASEIGVVVEGPCLLQRQFARHRAAGSTRPGFPGKRFLPGEDGVPLWGATATTRLRAGAGWRGGS